MAGSGSRLSRGERRARLWLSAAALAAYLPLIGVPFRGWLDFSAFWTAGHFAFSRQVLDLGTILRFQAENGLPPTPFVYPPGLALLYVPFAALPYDLAAALHVAVTLGALIVAARLWADLIGLPRRWAVLGALAWGPAAASVVSGQNATFVLLLAALAASGLAKAGARAPGPGFRIGFIAGLAMYKPQLGAGVTALVASRGGRWAIAGILVAGLGQYLAGVVATGMDLGWPVAWLSTVSAYGSADYVANGWQAISGPSIGAHLGEVTGSPIPQVIGWVAAALFVGWAIRGIRQLPAPIAVALAATAGLVIDPHAWIYDATLLLPAVGLIAVDASRRGWPERDRVAVAGAFAIAAFWPFGAFIGTSLVPILVVAVPIALRRVAWGMTNPAADADGAASRG